ncbi:small cell adhesion glycoprotein [Tachyglossus aculeatus]|uniref:small cell adhesion glycoprotein n=1 Tax=Tachyglossus aculeatus TaxID=9261 RepID=UPI0018F322DF|nr:small cell adhesion glycoprotein [Tachyglossus aculeatus]
MDQTPPPPAGGILPTSPLAKATDTLSGDDTANTAVIAVVITVVFVTMVSALAVIVIYLYKNKGTYVTYEAPEDGPAASVQVESSGPRPGKEEYFI